MPTHDVDAIHPVHEFRLLKKAVITRQFSEIPEAISQSPNPFDTFEKICEIDARYDATSTFFFLRNRGPNDSNYDFLDDGVPEKIRMLHAKGHEIGLHGSRASHTDPRILIEEKNLLESVTGEPITSIRQHSLWLDKIPTRTWEAQRIAGFEYDCTYVPQEFGETRRLHPFQAVEGLTEIPLAIPERDYEGFIDQVDLDGVWNRLELILDRYRRNEGTCCILWHPHTFHDPDDVASRLFYPQFEGFAELYERVLEYGYDHGAEIVSVSTAGEHADTGKPRW